MQKTVAGCVVTLLACACSGGGSKGPTTVGVEDFECKGRRAEYTVTGGLMSVGKGLVEPEAGVTVTCVGEEGPRLEKWRMLNDKGDRQSSSHPFTADQFETFWAKIESSGWRNLSECENPGAPADDPLYAFVIADHQTELSTSCPGRDLPFPFDRLRNELDLAAAGYGK
jgi:hypothetical protein